MYYSYVETRAKVIDNGGSIIVPTGGDGSAAWVRLSSKDKGVGSGLPRKMKKRIFGTKRMRRRLEERIIWFGAVA